MVAKTADDLVQALQRCGLFGSEQFALIAAAISPFGSNTQAALQHLVDCHHLSAFQARKFLAGKTAELFFGPYIISDRLGEGGMGRVYRARHARLGREVALKVIRPNLLANPIIRGRYEREARAAAKLVHPNIVQLIDADEFAGRSYLAMEFVDGVDLARLVANYGVLSVPEACEYIRQASLGLQHAHEHGFVHRDIKPSNIVVSGERHIPRAHGPAHVKVLDMGLIRGGFEEMEGGTDLTRDGTVVGTPDYMAPEQARNSSTVDHRADLYALGCTFYVLLTRDPPFIGGNALDKLFKHQTDQPRPLQAVRPDVPAGLAQIVARLMAKKPEQRFASAAELAAYLVPFTRLSEGPAIIPAASTSTATTETPPPNIATPSATPVVAGIHEPPAAPSPFAFTASTMPALPASTRSTKSRSVSATNRTGLRTGTIVGIWLFVVAVLGVSIWFTIERMRQPEVPATPSAPITPRAATPSQVEQPEVKSPTPTRRPKKKD